MGIVNIHVQAYPTHADVRGSYLMAVLTSGHLHGDQDFAVYAAIVPLEDPIRGVARDKMSHWVAGSGAKQSLAQARLHFPHLTEANYRP